MQQLGRAMFDLERAVKSACAPAVKNHMRTLILLTAILASLSVAGIADAQTSTPDPTEFTPPGHEFCGWKDLQNHRWVMDWDDSLTGAFFVVFANGMSCDAARHNASRISYSRRHGFQAHSGGLYVQDATDDIEFADVRCTKVNGMRRFRFPRRPTSNARRRASLR
jgi:hypothetical protein